MAKKIEWIPPQDYKETLRWLCDLFQVTPVAK